jgi:hypothetical protein
MLSRRHGWPDRSRRSSTMDAIASHAPCKHREPPSCSTILSVQTKNQHADSKGVILAACAIMRMSMGESVGTVIP